MKLIPGTKEWNEYKKEMEAFYKQLEANNIDPNNHMPDTTDEMSK